LDHPLSHSSHNFQETLLAARSISLKLYVKQGPLLEISFGAELSATRHMMRPMAVLPVLPLKPGPFFRHPKLVSSFSAWKSTTHKTCSKPSGSTHPETDLHDAKSLQGPAIWDAVVSVGQRCETSTNDDSSIYCGAGIAPRVPENTLPTQS
jgi:hypothetical protein